MNNIQNLFSVSEVDLVYRNKINPADRFKITNSYSAYDVLINKWDLAKIDLVEQFNILLLNRGNYCLAFSHIATGGVSCVIADPKIIFATALKVNASSIVVAHNHPSGDLKPSNADLKMTQKLVEAGRLLDIEVVDHLDRKSVV